MSKATLQGVVNGVEGVAQNLRTELDRALGARHPSGTIRRLLTALQANQRQMTGLIQDLEVLDGLRSPVVVLEEKTRSYIDPIEASCEEDRET